MEKIDRISYQTEDVLYKAGTQGSAKYTSEFELDTHYDQCDGIQVYEILNGGISYYQIGIDDKNTFYNTLVHKADYISGPSVDPNSRYKTISIPIVSGNKIKVNTYIPALLATDLYYQIVFRLRRSQEKR